MTISWADQLYCGGFSYSLTLISAEPNAPKLTEIGDDGNVKNNTVIEQELNQLYTFDGTDELNGYPDSSAWFDPATGIGVWTVQLKGTTGQKGASGLSPRGNEGEFSSI